MTRLRPEMLGRLTSVLYALSGAALLVLLIAVANVSNLLLAQSLEQQNEAAVRTALGASRARLVRQFLTYGVLLSGIGGLIGVLLTFWSVGPLVALSPLYGAGEFDIEPRLDWPTLAFTIAMTMAVGVAFGVLPAIGMSRARASDVLRAVGRSGTLSLGSRRWLKGLVVVELALAFVLLVGACVMGQGLLALHRETWGFDRRDVMTFDVAVSPLRYPERAQQEAFVHDLLERLASLPGVAAVGATSTPPFYAGTEAAAFNSRRHSTAGARILSRAFARRDAALLRGAGDPAARRPSRLPTPTSRPRFRSSSSASRWPSGTGPDRIRSGGA